MREFGDDEVYVVAMETEDDVFRREHLERLRRLTDAIAQLPEVRRVQSLVDVVSFRWVPEEDWIDVGSFIEEIPEDPAALAALRREALAHPLFRRTLISADGRTAAVNVCFRKMTDREFIDSRLDARIAALLAAEAAPGVRFHVAGRPHVKDAVYHWMLRDLRVLIPASVAVFAALLFLVFGTRRGVVLPLSMTVVATLWTFGAIAFLGRSALDPDGPAPAHPDHDRQRLRGPRALALRGGGAPRGELGGGRARTASSTCGCRCWSRASRRSPAGSR